MVGGGLDRRLGTLVDETVSLLIGGTPTKRDLGDRQRSSGDMGLVAAPHPGKRLAGLAGGEMIPTTAAVISCGIARLIARVPALGGRSRSARGGVLLDPAPRAPTPRLEQSPCKYRDRDTAQPDPSQESASTDTHSSCPEIPSGTSKKSSTSMSGPTWWSEMNANTRRPDRASTASMNFAFIAF